MGLINNIFCNTKYNTYLTNLEILIYHLDIRKIYV